MPRPSSEPAIDRVLTLSDGRKLAYCEWGDLEGMPVVLLHGWQNSRLFCPDEDATVRAGVRLITFDRPGYGGSDPSPGRTLLSGALDYGELVHALDLGVCPIVGWSGGGPYALACATRVPELVSAVGLAASDGPWDEVPGALAAMPVEARTLRELLLTDRERGIEAVQARCGRRGAEWERMFDSIGTRGDRDDLLMAQPKILEPMMVWFREGARTGAEGFAEDWIAELTPWGFSLADVGRRVTVWHGEADAFVDRAHAEYLATAIPQAKFVTYPGEGHLFPVEHWHEMLDSLLRHH